MRIEWAVMAGLGVAGLLVAATPAQAQAQAGTTGSSEYGQTSKSKGAQDTGAMGSTYGSTTSSQMGTSSEVTAKVDKFDQTKKELTLRLPVSDDTQVTKDGKRATLSDIKEGDQVRASFSGSGDQIKVNRIDVMTAKPGSSELPSGLTPSAPKSTGTRGY